MHARCRTGLVLSCALLAPLLSPAVAHAAATPLVTVSSPAENAVVAGLVAVTGTATVDTSAGDAAVSVTLQIDGTSTGPAQACPASTPASCPFNLTWDAFTGASAATDFISLEITDATGKLVFQLPDACKQMTLAVTATSAVLPKELFTAGKVSVATLSFFRLNDKDKAMPGTVSKGVAATAQVTRMQLKTIGGATAPVLRNLVVNAGGSLDLTVDAMVGHTFTLEHTTTLGGPFTQQIITNPPSATFHLTVPLGGQDFFRGRSD